MTTLQRTVATADDLPFTTKNQAGQLIVPVSAPTATWYTDTGRTLGPVALTVAGSGSSYTASWTAPQAPAVAGTRYLKFLIETATGVFSVDADDDIEFSLAGAVVGTDVVTAAEIRAQCGITSTVNPSDETLLAYASAHLARLEHDIGSPVIPRTLVEELPVRRGLAVLRHMRPLSLTSVVDADGDVLTDGQLVNSDGIVRFSSAVTYDDPLRPVTFTYTAGFASVPQEIKSALLLLVQINYSRERQGYMPGYGEPNEQPAGPSMVMYYALISQHRSPGFA